MRNFLIILMLFGVIKSSTGKVGPEFFAPKDLKCKICNPDNGYICDGEEEGNSMQCPIGSICSTYTCTFDGVTQTIKQCTPYNSIPNLDCQHYTQDQVECNLCFCDTDNCNVGQCTCQNQNGTTTTTERPTFTTSTIVPTTEDPLQCDINTRCKGSPVLSYSFTFDQAECLYQCQSFTSSQQSNCNWITFDVDSGLCELFEDCPSTDIGDCYGCISSEVGCETACYVRGNCKGNIIDFNHNVESMRNCINVCKSLSSQDCNWISYNPKEEFCLAFENCDLEYSNEEFLTAHVSCGI